MRLVLIPDKFKGSLTAAEVRQAIEAGVREVYPRAEFACFAASDGGDGFLEAVRAMRNLETFRVSVSDPLGREIEAPLLMDTSTGEAFIEMATASGMELLELKDRNPGRTHTHGTGQLIREAISRGAKSVYVGLGGSATNDGGCGLATAFGYRFLDGKGRELEPTGENLLKIRRIEPPSDRAPFGQADIIAVNDVANPLWGPRGAAYVYASQKGAASEQIPLLDRGLRHLDQLVQDQLGISAAKLPGAGAAGGATFGLHCFLGAFFVSGTDYILELSGIEAYLKHQTVDFICTGEGRIDSQTLNGKLIQGVVELAGRYSTPLLALCGTCDVAVKTLKERGIHEILEVSDPEKPLTYNLKYASNLTRKTVSRYFRELSRDY